MRGHSTVLENEERRKALVALLKQYPTHPKLTLAKIAHKQDPALFPSVDATRRLIQTLTGVNGKKSQALKDKSLFRPKGVAGADPWEAMMPDTWAEPLEPFHIPANGSLLVLSDIHVPFHDPDALKVAIRHGRNEKVGAVLLNGDTLDFYAVSDHEKDPRKVDWMGELEAGRQVLRMVRSAFPNVPVYFKEGNHEYRMERHLMKHAALLLGMPEFELPTLLRMGELGIEFIGNKRMIHAGELNIGHGDEWKGGGGINPARWASLRAKENVLVGHFHRPSEHIERTVRGRTRGYWSTGCLCELTPKYLPYNEWCHGFAVVHLNTDGTFEVENRKIIDGKVR